MPKYPNGKTLRHIPTGAKVRVRASGLGVALYLVEAKDKLLLVAEGDLEEW